MCIKQNQKNVSMQKRIPTTENKKNDQIKHQRSLTTPNIACRNGHQLHKTNKNEQIKNQRSLTIPNIASFPKITLEDSSKLENRSQCFQNTVKNDSENQFKRLLRKIIFIIVTMRKDNFRYITKTVAFLDEFSRFF